MKSQQYLFKLGEFNDDLPSRLMKLEKISEFLSTYEDKSKIFSFDLSLNTKDVIIKKNYEL